jgi:hypothetical protein
MHRGIVSLLRTMDRRSGKPLAARYIETSRLMRSPETQQIDRTVAEFTEVETVQLAPLSLRIGKHRGPGLPFGLRRPRMF